MAGREHVFPATNHGISALLRGDPEISGARVSSSEVPFWDELVADDDSPLIKDGYITMTEKPGIGVTLNEEVARKYARRGEPFFE